jgi:hypothetical protein
MSKITSFGFKSILPFFLLTILSTILALGVFSSSATAQPGEDPNYQYPILEEKDFTLYINLLAHIEQKKDPTVFFKQNNVTEEYVQAVVMKISMNAMAKLMEKTGELEQEFGKSIIFTSSEDAIYQKYEEQILTGLVQLSLSDEEKADDN